MSMFILEVQFIDARDCSDKEFNALEEILSYLTGYNESDFEWLVLHDMHNNMVVDGWSEIHRYIRENTGPVLPIHDLSRCGDACNCVKCNPFKTPYDATESVESKTSTNVSTESQLPRVERFSDLPDGTEFYAAQTYAYGGRKLYQKTMEDGGDHNAVEVGNTNIGVRVNGLQLVIRKQ